MKKIRENIIKEFKREDRYLEGESSAYNIINTETVRQIP